MGLGLVGNRTRPFAKWSSMPGGWVNETLGELSKLPECVEPGWLEKLEEEE